MPAMKCAEVHCGSRAHFWHLQDFAVFQSDMYDFCINLFSVMFRVLASCARGMIELNPWIYLNVWS